LDVTAALKLGREKWLDRQLEPGKIDDAAVATRLEKFPTTKADMGDMVSSFQRSQQERRAMLREQQMNGDSAMRIRRPREPGQSPQAIAGELVAAKLTRSVYSERQLEEMMTDFWFNHFNVFFGKGIDRYLIADYEAKAIRAHVFGKFRDLLGATAKHPAMLFYLDNAQSVAPDSMNPDARRQRQQLDRLRELPRARQEELLRRRGLSDEQIERFLSGDLPPAARQSRGLNENYARELMELHTLGVDGGYTQKDVIDVARAFTGWQFTRPGQRGAQDMEFVFRPQQHDRGEKLVLGQKLESGRGQQDGEDVLDLLAKHPSTAKFIARKLVERFVSDDPPAELVNHVAEVFTKTDGDLRAVTRALFTAPEFYDAKYVRAKIKTPFELVASALRVTHADVGVSRATMQALRTLGQLPYNEPAPTGFPAASEDWVNSGAMLNRMNFGLALAANRLDGVRFDTKSLTGDVQSGSVEEWVPAMLKQLLPGIDASKLENTILTELNKAEEEPPPATKDEMRQERRNPLNAPVRQKAGRALGLALGSPDFQRK
jgi:uncharacterized protein (DUF1800 family)